MKKNKNATKYSDSEIDDGSGNDSDDAQSDSENELDIDRKLISSTQIETKKTSKKSPTVKLQLSQILREQASSKLKHSVAIKKIPWESINIDGYTQDQLKEMLHEIIKATSLVRTLQEILADYEENHMKLDIASHSDYPTRPESASFRYIRQNRAKLTQHLEKQNPGAKITWPEVCKYGNEKFKALPDKKREVYVNQYKDALEEYRNVKAEFFITHPEMKLKKNGSKSSTGKQNLNVKAEKVKKQLLLTPFNQFRKELLEQGNPVALNVAQKMWKDLPNEEKSKYILEVVNMATDQDKKITRDEMKILDVYNGLPNRPLSAYNIFVKELKPTFTGNVKDFMAYASLKWKDIDEKEKIRLNLQADEDTEKWRRKMENYIKKLPVEQQPMMFAKYKVFQTPNKARKRKIKEELNGTDESVKVIKIIKKNLQSDSSDSDDEISKAPSPKKTMVKVEEIAVEKPPSPKKKKLKEPAYPSQTTAHYFMTMIYDGKPHKIAKAYKKLDQKEKSGYRDAMKKLRHEFLLNVGNYVKTLDSDEVKAYRLKMEEYKKKQNGELSWHINTGTDDEKTAHSSSSDSDSDSS